MRRGWKILIGVLVALAILLTVNTIVLNQETKAAKVTVSGGRILDLPGGAVQVVEQGPTVRHAPRVARGDRRFRPPIVLLHCFGCSLHWWDRMVPLLAKAPSRDPHRPARLRRLREAEERLLDGGAGAPRRPRPGQAPGPGRGRRRPLDGVRRGDRARRRVQRAGRPPGRHRRCPGPQLRRPAVHGQADLHPGARAGAAADRPRLRDRGRLRVGLRPRLRPRRLLGPGHRRLQGDDLHLIRPLGRRVGRLRGRAAPRPAGPRPPPCRCW